MPRTSLVPSGPISHATSAARPGIRLKVLTLNLHKGFSAFGRRVVLHDIRTAVRLIDADLVFLQEVMGEDDRNAHSQYEFLADSIWSDHAYGRNAVSARGHHGNALLSRYPISWWHNHDVTVHRNEPRGLLECEVRVPGYQRPLHAFCVHLGLGHGERQRQLTTLSLLVNPIAARGDPVVVAGDFNDWTHHGHRRLLSHTSLREVHALAGSGLARTFPARFPLLALDRIYTAHTTHQWPLPLPSKPWSRLSDHAPLAAEITL